VTVSYGRRGALLYVNGELDPVSSFVPRNPVVQTGVALPFWIGADTFNNRYHNGSILDVSYFVGQFKDGDVRRLYSLGPGGIFQRKPKKYYFPYEPRNTDVGVDSNGCLSFDGGDDYVNFNTNMSIKGLSAFTVSVWAKPTALNSGGVYGVWFEGINGLGITARARIFFENSSASYNNVANTVGVRFRAGDAGSVVTFSAGANVASLHAWHHIVFVFDSVNDVHKLYVNGRLCGTDSTAVPAMDNTSSSSVTFGVAGTSASGICPAQSAVHI
jgi:hypothetical protein